MVRWSWPRFRFDQLMALAWKVMLPLGLVNFVAVAFVSEFAWNAAEHRLSNVWPVVLAMWAVAVVSWWVAGTLAPLSTDNRPRTDLPDPATFGELGN
jgi:NADH-quinone oxidoreductase subunit H